MLRVNHEFRSSDKWGPEGKHLNPSWKTFSHWSMLIKNNSQLFLSVLGLIICWDKQIVIDSKEITLINISWKSGIGISNSPVFSFLIWDASFQDKLLDILPSSYQSTKPLCIIFFFSRIQPQSSSNFNITFFLFFFFLVQRLTLKPNHFLQEFHHKFITIISHSCFAITLAVRKHFQTF